MLSKDIVLNLFKKKLFRSLIFFVTVLLFALPFLIFNIVTTSFYNEIIFNISDDAKRVAKHIHSRHFQENSVDLLNKNMKKIIDDFNVYRIKYFDKDGVILSATVPKDIGTKNSNDYFYDKVAKGEIFYKVVKKGQKSMDKTIIEKDVVEIYIPIFKNKQFIGAFELYYDITDKIASFQSVKNRIGFLLLIVVVSLFLMIVFMLYSASRNDLKREIVEDELKSSKAKAEQASYAKSEFLANMSHEIRTPLNSVIGFIGLLLEEEEDEKKKKTLEIVDGSSKTLLQLINDILDFSKIESGKLEIEKISFSIEKEMENMSKMFDSHIQEKNINFTTNIDKDLPKFVVSDPLRIKQITLNLISNAIKFTPKDGSVTLDLNYLKDSNELEVSVRDTGIGISKENQKKVFDKFLQADSTTTRKYGGTGLGLAISRKLSKLLGGKLFLESKEGEGSRFFFIIPIDISREKIVEEKKDETPLNLGDKKILLVEDNSVNQMLFKAIAKKHKANVVVANDGFEGVEAYKNSSFDLIFMDEQMPNMDGITAIKEILKIEKESHTPIIALTANALESDRDRFLSVGADDFMGKPIDKTLFREMLKKYLG